MMVEKAESGGEGAWTKLLNETPSDASESTAADSVNGADGSCCQNQHQLLDCHSAGYSDEQVSVERAAQDGNDEMGDGGHSSGSVSICVDKDDSETTHLHSEPSEEKCVHIHRKESILGTFNKHLRRSLKAVSESPGPITR